MLRRLTVAGGALACGIAAAAQAPTAAQAPADLALLHGRIHTEDAQRSIAQAIALRGNTIIAVGTKEELQASTQPRVRQFLDRIPNDETVEDATYFDRLTGGIDI